MSTRYDDFDLVFRRSGERYSVQLINSPTGQAEGEFELPFSEGEMRRFYARIGQLGRTRSVNSPGMEAAKEFGGKLFDAVFQGELLGRLRSSSDLRGANRGLRLRLRMRDAPALAELPWEFLYDREQDHFLATSTMTPMVRYLDMAQRVTALKVHQPLRILVVIAGPKNLQRLDAEGEWTRLRTSLAALEGRGEIVLERLEGGTLDALRRRAGRAPFHILHFVGHGSFDPIARDGCLHFEDEKGMSDPVQGSFLGNILRDHASLRLVVLNACEGARQSTEDPFSGVAQSLCQQQMPAVIAMQFEISDDAAKRFAEEFYAAVAECVPVDAAVAASRKSMFNGRFGQEWATPVLYMRSPDGLLFDVQRRRVHPVGGDQDRRKAEDAARAVAADEEAKRLREARDAEAAEEEAKRLEEARLEKAREQEASRQRALRQEELEAENAARRAAEAEEVREQQKAKAAEAMALQLRQALEAVEAKKAAEAEADAKKKQASSERSKAMWAAFTLANEDVAAAERAKAEEAERAKQDNATKVKAFFENIEQLRAAKAAAEAEQARLAEAERVAAEQKAEERKAQEQATLRRGFEAAQAVVVAQAEAAERRREIEARMNALRDLQPKKVEVKVPPPPPAPSAKGSKRNDAEGEAKQKTEPLQAFRVETLKPAPSAKGSKRNDAEGEAKQKTEPLQAFRVETSPPAKGRTRYDVEGEAEQTKKPPAKAEMAPAEALNAVEVERTPAQKLGLVAVAFVIVMAAMFWGFTVAEVAGFSTSRGFAITLLVTVLGGVALRFTWRKLRAQWLAWIGFPFFLIVFAGAHSRLDGTLAVALLYMLVIWGVALGWSKAPAKGDRKS